MAVTPLQPHVVALVTSSRTALVDARVRGMALLSRAHILSRSVAAVFFVGAHEFFVAAIDGVVMRHRVSGAPGTLVWRGRAFVMETSLARSPLLLAGCCAAGSRLVVASAWGDLCVEPVRHQPQTGAEADAFASVLLWRRLRLQTVSTPSTHNAPSPPFSLLRGRGAHSAKHLMHLATSYRCSPTGAPTCRAIPLRRRRRVHEWCWRATPKRLRCWTHQRRKCWLSCEFVGMNNDRLIRPFEFLERGARVVVWTGSRERERGNCPTVMAQEPTTGGSVLLDTTAGPIAIELYWCAARAGGSQRCHFFTYAPPRVQAACAPHVPELLGALTQGLLRRHRLSPRDQGLHDPRRRSDGHGPRGRVRVRQGV